MGASLNKICCWCCQYEEEEDKEPLLQREKSFCVIEEDEFPQVDSGPNLLEEHDSIYTIHGVKRKNETKRGYSTKRLLSPKSAKKQRRYGSVHQTLIERDDSDQEHEILVPPTKRQLTAMELLQTETSYIRNLKIIVEVYKKPLDAAVVKCIPILDNEDIKAIFGGVNDILAVHMDLHKDLSDVIENWDENCVIADVIVNYKEKLTKVYPPYVNYFDMSKEVILKRQKSNPAFSEFLLNCFNNPTCLKQPLDVLLIRPVQRLPSMSLLIQDLKRRTPEDLADFMKLEDAVDSLKTVLSQINEDKRKTEGLTKIFDIIYQVEGCPDNLISSNRLFVARSDVTTMNDGLYRADERLALFLLTDVMVITKWKRSPKKNAPLLKHIMTLPLTNITLVYDITDKEESIAMFALQLSDGEIPTNNNPNQWKPLDKICVCQPLDGRYHMGSFLKSLAQQITVKENTEAADNILKTIEANELQSKLKRGSKALRRVLSQKKND